ncbi:programmed cell death 1 ligand 1-like isoform X2 [Labrus mixtus]|uniref:programmed cell death 1 ligand 1-like isoform X2 n=1 Tax=Labrus mixtus TaxID=508554 RepID=UPI0029C0293A|nr:programmed cell death 1 ligand 1-like isoform X2 [Labrus mixtus]
MDWALLLVLQVMFQPSLTVLFTVEVEQSTYDSEFGGDVVLGCRFQPNLSTPLADIKVTWHRIHSASTQHVYWLANGKEHLESQDPAYKGRVKLLREELKTGLARLQISGLKISDSGTYKCLVQTSEGADYKPITLSVKATYKAITKDIQKVAEGDGVLLTCQSKGYPESSVMWQDGNMQRLYANTTTVSTADQRFKVTSQIHVQPSDQNNYTCSFVKDASSATFLIPDEMPVLHEENNALIIIMCIVVTMVGITVAVLMYQRHKGLQIEKENEEEITMFNEGSTEEKLGAFLKAHYSELSFTEMPRQYWEAFGVEVLPQRLQNNEGQPVNLQALLPEAGETLLLEGPPRSGKTTLAHILVSSWTEGPKHAFPDLLDLSAVGLLLYIDCSGVKGDLHQEITSQLSLTEKTTTEDKLRTLLSRSSEALLLLDGYTEGNQSFDETLRTFLRERGGCRVLVTTCVGHCDTLREIVGTGRVLELQNENV